MDEALGALDLQPTMDHTHFDLTDRLLLLLLLPNGDCLHRRFGCDSIHRSGGSRGRDSRRRTGRLVARSDRNQIHRSTGEYSQN